MGVEKGEKERDFREEKKIKNGFSEIKNISMIKIELTERERKFRFFVVVFVYDEW